MSIYRIKCSVWNDRTKTRSAYLCNENGSYYEVTDQHTAELHAEMLTKSTIHPNRTTNFSYTVVKVNH